MDSKGNDTSLSITDNGGVYAGIASGSVLGLVFLVAGTCALFRFCCAAMKVSTSNTKTDNTYTSSYNKSTEKERETSRTRHKFNLHQQLQENRIKTSQVPSYNITNGTRGTAVTDSSKDVYS